MVRVAHAPDASAPKRVQRPPQVAARAQRDADRIKPERDWLDPSPHDGRADLPT